MKILLVEDSATLRHAHSSHIRNAGHTPIIAESGEEALQMVENTPVDMIIMDVEMPGLNGFETTKLMREWLGDYWIPIIFVTGKSDDESYREGIEAGGDDYLIKPVSPAILHAKITAMERIADMRDQLRELNAELETLSQRDGLTKVYNRRTFDEYGKQQWLVANRKQQPIGVLMIDIDHFKSYNDFYGHLAGDECLAKVAEAMKESVHRPTDILARYGGEEFIILLPDTDIEGALQVGNAIRYAVEDLKIQHQASTTSRVVTVSIGAATTRHTTGRTLQDLINCADKALYKSKRSGRNRVTAEEYSLVKNILIADDDPDTLNLLTSEFQGICQIMAAENGDECVELAHSLQPDLVILDIDMPGMDSVEFYKSLRQASHDACIPILLISRREKNELMEAGEIMGANNCIQKPAARQFLLTKINSFLG
jgi:diguanylate cyclase (GGDEF)-like protein